MDIQMIEKLSNAFGPSGFEEDVVRTLAEYCGEFDISNDAMNNFYVRMPGVQSEKPVVQLDAHLDECGMMVQSILDNVALQMLLLGGFHLTSLPGTFCEDKNKIGKDGARNYLCEAGSFYDGFRTQRTES